MTYYQRIAHERTASHKRRKDPRDAPLTDKVDLIGVISEGEFAKKYNLPFQGNVGSRGDDGWDFVLADGRTLDVKGTDYKNGNLISPHRKPIRADIYVLAIVDIAKETAKFVGWATAEELRNGESRDWNNRGPVYFVDQKHLHPMEELGV